MTIKCFLCLESVVQIPPYAMLLVDVGAFSCGRLVFFHTIGTSGEDDDAKKKFRTAYERRMKALGETCRCVQCGCFTSANGKSCPHGKICHLRQRQTLTRKYTFQNGKIVYRPGGVRKISAIRCDSAGDCRYVAAHIHLEGYNETYLVNVCNSCNVSTAKKRGTITEVTVTHHEGPLYAWPLSRSFDEYLQ